MPSLLALCLFVQWQSVHKLHFARSSFWSMSGDKLSGTTDRYKVPSIRPVTLVYLFISACTGYDHMVATLSGDTP